MDPYRASNVFEFPFADVVECEIKLAGCIFLDPRRNTDATRLGQSFEPRRDVHPIAENIAVLDHNVADINSDTEIDLVRRPDISLRHALLDFHCAAQSINHASKLNEQAV